MNPERWECPECGSRVVTPELSPNRSPACGNTDDHDHGVVRMEETDF